MPSTLTKKARLSSGLGVSISKWPKWARSIMGSIRLIILLLSVLFGFAGTAIFGRTAKHLAAVGQDYLARVGCFVVVLGTEAFDRHFVAGLQRTARPSHSGQGIGRAVFTLPVLYVALFVFHVQINPDVGVRPFHFGHGALQGDWLLDVEFGGERMMREGGQAANGHCH